MKLFLQLNYLLITSNFNKNLVFKKKQINLQAQQNYIPNYKPLNVTSCVMLSNLFGFGVMGYMLHPDALSSRILGFLLYQAKWGEFFPVLFGFLLRCRLQNQIKILILLPKCNAILEGGAQLYIKNDTDQGIVITLGHIGYCTISTYSLEYPSI